MQTKYTHSWTRYPLKKVALHRYNMVQEPFEKQQVKDVDLASKFPRSQSYQVSVGCAGQTCPIHGDPTSQIIGHKGSAARVLVLDTMGHLQRSRGVDISVRAVRAAEEGLIQYKTGGYNFMAEWCKFQEVPRF